MAAVTILNTLARVGIVQEWGAAGGIPVIGAIVLLVAAGGLFVVVCGGSSFMLGMPEKLHWWLAMLVPLAAAANVAAAIVVLPEEHVVAWTVLDIYLFNGILALVATGLLLKRRVRAHFGISRGSSEARAA
ncbi:MAG TPA: hypothetical protein VM674_04355 [Candidatus Acidoferrum sp.]|nr:hypothetical protein [Candidatus Acidoferrum sp.]